MRWGGGFGGWLQGHDGRFAEVRELPPCSLDQPKYLFYVSHKFGAIGTVGHPQKFSFTRGDSREIGYTAVP